MTCVSTAANIADSVRLRTFSERHGGVNSGNGAQTN